MVTWLTWPGLSQQSLQSIELHPKSSGFARSLHCLENSNNILMVHKSPEKTVLDKLRKNV